MSFEEIEQYKKVDINYVEANKDALIDANIPVMRLNKENNLVTVPLLNLDILLGSSNDISFYIKKIYEKDLENILNIRHTKKDNENMDGPDDNIREMMSRFTNISMEEKIENISKHTQNLSSAMKNPRITGDMAKEIIDSQTDASLIVKIAMFESLSDIKKDSEKFKTIKEKNNTLTKETSAMVNTITKLLSKRPETKNIFHDLKNFSDGGVIAHQNRVFITYINFLYFYNKVVNEQSFVQRLRKQFMEKYGSIYQNLMDLHNGEKTVSSLEEIVESGIGRINDMDFMLYPIGAFMHDVGKIKDMDYFEGASGRDMERIQKHLFNSYYIVSSLSNYPPEIVLTVGFHHEYNNYGYGPFKTFYEIKKEKDPRFRMNYILTYNVDTIQKCSALGYFPAKMLEIVDVYDALIDPARKYRNGKVFTKEEALAIMRKDFIEEHTKLDPILFDIFIEYLASVE